MAGTVSARSNNEVDKWLFTIIKVFVRLNSPILIFAMYAQPPSRSKTADTWFASSCGQLLVRQATGSSHIVHSWKPRTLRLTHSYTYSDYNGVIRSSNNAVVDILTSHIWALLCMDTYSSYWYKNMQNIGRHWILFSLYRHSDGLKGQLHCQHLQW
jgi:hypothetical protein